MVSPEVRKHLSLSSYSIIEFMLRRLVGVLCLPADTLYQTQQQETHRRKPEPLCSRVTREQHRQRFEAYLDTGLDESVGDVEHPGSAQHAEESVDGVGVSMFLAPLALTGCGASPADTVPDTVRAYIEAVAAGDGAKAFQLNPNSVQLDEEELVISTAGEHLQLRSVGAFEAAAEPPAPTTEEEEHPWTTGSKISTEGQEVAESAMALADDVQHGFVPVTVAVGDQERTVPIGVMTGLVDGEVRSAFVPVQLTADQARQYSTAWAGAALAPAEILLEGDDEQSPATTVNGVATDGADLLLGVYKVEVAESEAQPTRTVRQPAGGRLVNGDAHARSEPRGRLQAGGHRRRQEGGTGGPQQDRG